LISGYRKGKKEEKVKTVNKIKSSVLKTRVEFEKSGCSTVEL
jgi:hypothetical protein